ncbi:aspartyl/asparaginyl beta-hydroxylase isoform X5 [Cervus canadensis]|uniref:aspartyl/asparaginyl beta-hydroxylase isoform X5 n=1 Tax=Cervus canadensis TaxID=1574408 RepID=UPI001C9E215C|nr:aspartyl/asparaginyl beta-hydroxylase isoform X5 [Cervus canadensis]
MAPRKNAKGGGGNSSSSSSGSPTGCTSGGSSSPGARRETKQGGPKNGRKGGLSGSSFFTWFMVIALLGVWTSVAVVWFDLVDYEEVLAKAKDFRYNLSEVLQGKLGIYDADGDGDFDVDDAKVLLGLKEKPAPKPTVPPEETDMYPWLEDQVLESTGPQNIEDEVHEQVQSLDETVYSEHGELAFGQREDRASACAVARRRGRVCPAAAAGENLHQEPEGPAEELQPEDHVFVGSDADDRHEPMGTGAFHEETEDSYHIEETASPAYSQDVEDMIYEQEIPDSSEPVVVDDAERTYQETDDVTYRDYDEQVYEPLQNEGTESSDNAVDNSNTILEELHMPPAEEQQEVPPEANKKADEPEKKGKVKKKKPKLLNKFDKTIKAELDAAEKLRKRGKIEEAVNAFEELVRKYPQSPGARYGKAQCEDDLAEKRRSNEILRRAIETYREAASLPNAPTDLVKLSLKRRSDRQQFLGHMRGSLLTLQKLVQLFPDDTSLKNDLGVGYLLIGDNDSAKKVYEEVLSVTPNDGFAKVHYGFILKAQNKIAESIPYLKEGIESGDPGTDDGRFYFHLGDAMQRVGNKESLERNWKLIRDEGLAAMDKTHGLFLPEDENLREKGDWSQFTLWQQGRKNENACKGAPKTCSLLDKFPETTGCRRGQIKYSIMHPGTHVWPHTGPTNCRLRMHLGLVIPKEGCKIRCANETRTWEEGKVLIFDDSFEHEVWQDAASFRLIFIVDVWHPELTPHQRRSLPAI